MFSIPEKLSDALTDIVEEAIYKEVLTTAKAQELYHGLATALGLSDLLTLNRTHPMHNGCIVVELPNQTAPDAFLTKVLEKYPTSWGYAVVDNGGIDYQALPGGAKLEDIKIVQETYKDRPRLHYFGNSPTGFLDDDLQPYEIIVDDNGSEVLLAVAEGNYPSFAKAESAHSSEFFLMVEHLRPKIKQMYEDCGKDIGKLVERLKGPVFSKELEMCFGLTPCTVTFFANVGENGMLFSQHRVGSGEDEKRVFKWGWASRSCGYEEAGDTSIPKKPTVSAEAKPMSKLEIMKAKLEAKKIADAAGVSDSTKKDLLDTSALNTSKTPEAAPKKMKTVKADNTWTKRQKEAYYRKELGMLPQNYKTCPSFEVEDKDQSAAITPVGKVVQLNAAQTEPPKDVATKVDALSAEDKKVLLDWRNSELVKKTMESGVLNTGSDKELSEQKRKPTFCESAGIERLSLTYGISRAQLLELQKKLPEQLVQLLMDYRLSLILSEAKVAGLEKKLTEHAARTVKDKEKIAM